MAKKKAREFYITQLSTDGGMYSDCRVVSPTMTKDLNFGEIPYKHDDIMYHEKVHVIEISALESLQAENQKLKDIIAKCPNENDDLGAEFVHVQILQEKLKEEKRLRQDTKKQMLRFCDQVIEKDKLIEEARKLLLKAYGELGRVSIATDIDEFLTKLERTKQGGGE